MSTAAVRFTSVTPNLVVRDVAASTAFYRDVLGFTVHQTVPDTPPHVFVWVTRGEVAVFLNDPVAAAHDNPLFESPSYGGTATLFFVIEGVDAFHALVAPRATMVMALRTQPYGMREFSIVDPDGHVLTFAERVDA